MITNPRRRLLRAGAAHAARAIAAAAVPALAAPALLLPSMSWATAKDPRRLALVHTHTHERIDIVYARAQRPIADAIGSLNRFLRDHYTGEIGAIDTEVLDLLFALHREVESERPFEIISAYRSPATNARLRRQGSGGVAKRSLHMQGRAIDVRLPGVALADLREAARSLKIGGVGYYPGSNFVHVDTGRVRHW